MAAPTMEERKACWGARDEFWRCLDSHGDDAAQCEKLRRAFEARCPQQWILESFKKYPELSVTKQVVPVQKGAATQVVQLVKHFDKRRDFLKYKKMLETEGYRPPEAAGKS